MSSFILASTTHAEPNGSAVELTTILDPVPSALQTSQIQPEVLAGLRAEVQTSTPENAEGARAPTSTLFTTSFVVVNASEFQTYSVTCARSATQIVMIVVRDGQTVMTLTTNGPVTAVQTTSGNIQVSGATVLGDLDRVRSEASGVLPVLEGVSARFTNAVGALDISTALTNGLPTYVLLDITTYESIYGSATPNNLSVSDECDRLCKTEIGLPSYCPGDTVTDQWWCCITKARQAKCRRLCWAIYYWEGPGGTNPGDEHWFDDIPALLIGDLPASVDALGCTLSAPLQAIRDLFR